MRERPLYLLQILTDSVFVVPGHICLQVSGPLAYVATALIQPRLDRQMQEHVSVPSSSRLYQEGLEAF